MANDLTGAIWRIDSTMEYKAPVKIVNASWVETAAAGDDLTVTTSAGKPILESKAYAVDYAQNFGFLGWVPSFKVTVIDSGVLLITVGSGK